MSIQTSSASNMCYCNIHTSDGQLYIIFLMETCFNSFPDQPAVKQRNDRKHPIQSSLSFVKVNSTLLL